MPNDQPQLRSPDQDALDFVCQPPETVQSGRVRSCLIRDERAASLRKMRSVTSPIVHCKLLRHIFCEQVILLPTAWGFSCTVGEYKSEAVHETFFFVQECV